MTASRQRALRRIRRAGTIRCCAGSPRDGSADRGVRAEEARLISTDVIVLGAGMVGTSAALHLQAKGKSVVLFDRRGIGEETSYGNAGIVEREDIMPVAVPREIGALIRYGLNLAPEANYHLSFLPKIAPWLFQLFLATDKAGIAAFAAATEMLSRVAIDEHRALSRQAGAEGFFRETGWVRLYRTHKGMAGSAGLHDLADQYGIKYQKLTIAELRELEPDLAPIGVGAVLWPETQSVSWPEGVTKAYGEMFVGRGGVVARGDARSLRRGANGWVVTSEAGEITAKDVVVALGPWSNDLLDRFDVKVPLAVKRGYHMHFAPKGEAKLGRPIVDVEKGYVITQMLKGIRLTTGIEFADRDAPPSPRQLEQLKPIARALFPLGAEADPEPWLGRRPVVPDGLPVLGPAPGVPDMWLDFAHGHLGFTLGPITGRLIAEAISGETPSIDLTPFRAERFGRK
jgi:D-amino-acid dehydrogenase